MTQRYSFLNHILVTASSCVGAILKDYLSGTIRISLPLDGGWGKDKVTTVFWSMQTWTPPQ